MKRINILTFSNTINYGGLLQSFSLCKTIENNGATPVLVSKKDPFPKESSKIKKTIKPLLRFGISLLQSRKRVHRSKNFLKRFKNNSSCLCDVQSYIVGSDQVWNHLIVNDDTKYLLADIKSENKYAYAASFGPIKLITHTWENNIKEYLKSFRVLSVRENSASEYLNKIGFKSQVDCDPTMLLTKKEWRLIEKPIKTPCFYILVYLMPGNKETVKMIRDFAEKKSKELGMPVLYIGNKPTRRFVLGEKNLFSAGPEEFVYLLDKASYIITNSFHGLSFGLYFGSKVSFISTKNSIKNGDDRAMTLLTRFNLTLKDDCINEYDFSDKHYDDICVGLREKSLTYIKEIIDE